MDLSGFEMVKRFYTVKQIPSYYPAFTESSIRYLIFNQKQNGFDSCIRKIGKKILIDADDFENWIATFRPLSSVD
jgi:hypothetical protein